MEKDMRMQRIGAPIAPGFLFSMLPLCFFHQKQSLKVTPAVHPEYYLALDDVSLYHGLCVARLKLISLSAPTATVGHGACVDNGDHVSET